MRGREGPAARFAIVVVNYGSSHLIADNLARESVAEHGGIVVVVDNYTSDGERAAVNALASANGWLAVLLDDNRGFGGGMNEGARCAMQHGADVIVALNPDARIENPDLMRLVDAVAADTALMAAPVIRTGVGSVWFDGSDLYLDSGRVASRRRTVLPSGPREAWISGACFAMSRLMWERVGGFDEQYFLYWEDVDLSRRVVESGGRLGVLRSVNAVHDAGGTQARVGAGRTKSELYYFYNIRNRLLYAAKHLEDERLRRWLRATPRVSYEILLTGGRRQLLRSVAPWRAYLCGMWAGWRMLREIRGTRLPARSPSERPRSVRQRHPSQ